MTLNASATNYGGNDMKTFIPNIIATFGEKGKIWLNGLPSIYTAYKIDNLDYFS